MRPTARIPITLGCVALCMAPLRATESAGQNADLVRFRDTCDQAMSRMMQGMEAPQGATVDQQFVSMMVPHHQGAIDMAMAELRYGHDERLRRIAQEIIIDQQQEIRVMHLVIGQRGDATKEPAPRDQTPILNEKAHTP